MDPKNPDTVDKIAALAKDANGFTLHEIESGENTLGLPTKIVVGFDHRAGGSGLKSLKPLIEEFRLYPERRKGTAHISTLNSFIDLANRHKSQHSAIFAATSWPNPWLTAVIDYHEKVNLDDATDAPQSKEKPKPAFCQHRIHYPFPLTEEFKAWADSDGTAMDQGEFAAFIEERVAELSQASREEETLYGELFGTRMATPADMLTLSRGLEVNVAGKVKQNVRLQSGETEIEFVEEHLDANGSKITVPGLFMVCVPAFLDGMAVRLPARLRYRVSGGAVTWSYQLYRWKELLRERVVADLDHARTETGLPAYEGSPES